MQALDKDGLLREHGFFFDSTGKLDLCCRGSFQPPLEHSCEIVRIRLAEKAAELEIANAKQQEVRKRCGWAWEFGSAKRRSATKDERQKAERAMLDACNRLEDLKKYTVHLTGILRKWKQRPIKGAAMAEKGHMPPAATRSLDLNLVRQLRRGGPTAP